MYNAERILFPSTWSVTISFISLMSLFASNFVQNFSQHFCIMKVRLSILYLVFWKTILSSNTFCIWKWFPFDCMKKGGKRKCFLNELVIWECVDISFWRKEEVCLFGTVPGSSVLFIQWSTLSSIPVCLYKTYELWYSYLLVIQLVAHFEDWRSVLFLLLLKVTIQVVVKVGDGVWLRCVRPFHRISAGRFASGFPRAKDHFSFLVSNCEEAIQVWQNC